MLSNYFNAHLEEVGDEGECPPVGGNVTALDDQYHLFSGGRPHNCDR